MAEVVIKRKEKGDLLAPLSEELLNDFLARKDSGDELSRWQRDSFALAQAAATPTNKDEDFKYVNFRLLKFADLQPISSDWNSWKQGKLLAVGVTDESSVPQEYSVEQVQGDPESHIFFGSFAEAMNERKDQLHDALELIKSQFPARKFALFSHAFLSQGAFLQVEKNTEESTSRQIFTRFADADSLCSPASIAMVEENARASLVWDIDSVEDASGIMNGTMDVIVKDGSHLNLLITQHLSNAVNSISTIRIYLGRDAQLEMAMINSGGRVNQMEIDVKMADRGSSALVNGVYLGRERENFNLLTHQHHKVGNTGSDLFYIGTLSGKSSSNYLGKITIDPGAQQSDAYQKNRNLILNRGCSVNSSPKLEISANDVRCSHGATTAKVSDLEMYYLQSRGIERSTAKVLLADGFISQVTARIKSELLRDGFARRLQALLHRWGGH